MTKYAACVALSTTNLDVNKKICQPLQVKKASFASMEQTIQQTDMKIGGIPIFGIRNMPIYVDSKVFYNEEIVMGGGNKVIKSIAQPAGIEKTSKSSSYRKSCSSKTKLSSPSFIEHNEKDERTDCDDNQNRSDDVYGCWRNYLCGCRLKQSLVRVYSDRTACDRGCPLSYF
jgi:hypothetical protein